MSPSSPPERRQSVRLELGALAPIDAELTCMSSGKLLSGRLVSISADGCSLALGAGQETESGIRCALRFELAEDQRYYLLATIMRRAQANQSTEIGLRFDTIEINQAPRRRLAELIMQLAADGKDVRG